MTATMETGKDLPAEGQIAASVGQLLSDPTRYLEWERRARAESRAVFAKTFQRMTPGMIDDFHHQLDMPRGPGVTSEDLIAD